MYNKRERRLRRSKRMGSALNLLVDAIAERFGLISLVLGDDQGFVVAGRSPLVDAEELAARAPLVERKIFEPMYSGWPLSVWPVHTCWGNLVFCAIGEKRAAGAATLIANKGVRRIVES